jgi:hypothetical protein
MAKKVKRRMVRAKKQKTVASRTPAKVAAKKAIAAKPVKKRRAPFILNIIAAVLLLVNGILMTLANKWIATMVTTYGGTLIEAQTILSLGIVWLILGILTWVSTIRVENRGNTAEKWYLFALGVITLITGRIESGVLIIIGSIIYLNKK